MGKKTLMSKRLYVILCMALAALLSTVIFTVGASAEGEKCEITSVTLNKSLTDLSFEIELTKEYVKENKSETVYLFEFLPYQSTSDISFMEPVKSFKVKPDTSFKIPYIVGNTSRLYSKFAVAEISDDGAYSLITPAHYVDNIDAAAKNSEAYPEKSSVKGLQIGEFSEAQQLGVSHTVVNIPINEYMLSENSDKALSFLYDGQTYYLDREKIALLDHKVKIYTEAGVNVYFNIILTKPTADTGEAILSLYNEGISQDAALYAVNTRNERGMRTFIAFMDYMCARYTDPAHTHGFVPAIIVGFEVNSNTVWNNVGTFDLSGYVYSYCTAFRAAYTAMRSNYSEGRVYMSLGNNFCHVDRPDADFPAKDFLNVFASAIKNSGDIPWGVSINPYSSETELVEFWNDTKAKNDFETPYITMKNLSTFTEYMSREALLFEGETRSVIVGEWGVSGDPADQRNMNIQAASYALAYYTVAKNEHIDAFIYKRQIDYPVENAFYGLYACKSGTIGEPGDEKPIKNIFSAIDTAQGEENIAFIKETVGSGVFSTAVGDNVKYKDFEKRAVISAEAVTEKQAKKGTKTRSLFDFGNGSFCGFYPTDSVEYVELKDLGENGGIVIHSVAAGVPDSYKGIGSASIPDSALKRAKYITLRVMVTAPEGVNTAKLALRLADYSPFSAEYTGTSDVSVGQWQDVSFDVRSFMKLTDYDADVMKIWMAVDGESAADGEYGLLLDSVNVRAGRGMPIFLWFLIVPLVLVVLAVAAYGVLYLRAQMIRKKRREAAMRRRAQMQQSQVMNIPRSINGRNGPNFPLGR